MPVFARGPPTVPPRTRHFITLTLAHRSGFRRNHMVCQHSLHHTLVSPLRSEWDSINTENTHNRKWEDISYIPNTLIFLDKKTVCIRLITAAWCNAKEEENNLMVPYHFTVKAFFEKINKLWTQWHHRLSPHWHWSSCSTLQHTEPSLHEYLGLSVTGNKYDLVGKLSTQGHCGS